MTTNVSADRVFNFSAGPAVLPLPVLEQVQSELLSLPGCGASILEISHRSRPFIAILEEAQQRLRDLLSIPPNYRILFLQGGSRLMFSMVPMNLLRGQPGPADYALTGSWGKKALAEGKREGATNVVWDGRDTNYDRVPAWKDIRLSDQSAYVHITSNETIEGVQFREHPNTGDVPLVCDSSSDFLCRPLPVEKYGLIYACAQKNAGPAGVTVVILREDLLERSSSDLPGYLNFANHAADNSLYNTPPTFAIYVLGLVTRWLETEMGGLAKMEQRNQEKADLLYDVIDQSEGFYRGHSVPECRSIMNVTFRLGQQEQEAEFLKEAERQGLASLKGHRSVGGIRASIYNAMPLEGVTALRDFMKDFARQHGS